MSSEITKVPKESSQETPNNNNKTPACSTRGAPPSTVSPIISPNLPISVETLAYLLNNVRIQDRGGGVGAGNHEGGQKMNAEHFGLESGDACCAEPVDSTALESLYNQWTMSLL